MPRYLVWFQAEVEVEAEDAGYAEELALQKLDVSDLYCGGVEEA